MLIIVTILVKFLGFLREVIIGNFFGTSYKKDALVAAQLVPGVFFASIMASFSTTFIPLYNDINIKKGKENADKFVNNVLLLISVSAIAISIIGIAFSQQIVHVIVGGFSYQQKLLTSRLLKITFVYIIFLGINYIFQAYLQSNKSFIIPALTSIPFNIVIISLSFFAKYFDIYIIAIGFVLGYFSMVFFQYFFIIKKGFKIKISLSFFRDEYIKKMFILILPVFIGSSVSSLNSFVDKYLASRLYEGSISALDYAERLNGLIYGIFSAAISTIMYPYLSQLFAKKQYDEFRKYLSLAINSLILIMVPISFGMIILNKEIVEIIYQRGAFSEHSTRLTSGAVSFFAIGYLGYSIRDILSRTFYSIQDTITPMKNGIIAVILNILLNIILVNFLAHKGLALGTSLVSYFSVFLLLKSLKNKIGSFYLKENFIVFLKVIFASLIMSLTIIFVKEAISISQSYNFIQKAIVVSIYITVGAVSYITFIFLFRVNEMNWLIKNSIKKLKGR